MTADSGLLPTEGVEQVSDVGPMASGPMSPRMQGVLKIEGLLKRLGSWMYSDPSISIRELLQNANDSCVMRQADDPCAPAGEIRVSFDNWSRRLSVEDNGTGLTEDEIMEFLAVIGSSKTNEVRARLEDMGHRGLAERLIGRYGLGLLSAFMIGDRIEIVTFSYKEGAQPLWWENRGDSEYWMGRAASRREPGTTVTIDVDPKYVGMLQDDELKALIHLYAEFLEVPVYLNAAPQPVNAVAAPWSHEAPQSEYRQFANERYPNDAILDIIPVKIDEDGRFRLGGVLLISEQSLSADKADSGLAVYVRGMYVCDEERSLLPEWASFVKGVIETPNLHETTSREAVRHDENFEHVQRTLSGVIRAYLARIAKENPNLFKKVISNHKLVSKALNQHVR